MALPIESSDNEAGMLHPATSMADATTEVNRSVPGIQPEHALIAAQTHDPVEAAHAIAGMNILTNHLIAHQHAANVALVASQGAAGPQGVKSAPKTSTANPSTPVGARQQQAPAGSFAPVPATDAPPLNPSSSPNQGFWGGGLQTLAILV